MKQKLPFYFTNQSLGGNFTGGMRRFSDMLPHEGAPAMSLEAKNLIMHVELPILGGHVLMGTDAPETMGLKLVVGNNISINLQPDTREETDKLFKELSSDGKIEMPLQDAFWGDYFGACTDKFGIHWMFNSKKNNFIVPAILNHGLNNF